MSNSLSTASFGFGDLSIKKQVSILLGLAISISLGVYVAIWSQKSNLVPLYAHLEPSEVSKIVDILNKSNIEHAYNKSGTGILVDADKLSEIRMKLAAQGLPKSSGVGFEMLNKPQGLGVSQFLESVKYRISLEGELARTISGLEGVKSARVHLGIAKTSSFLKRNIISGASVMLELLNGHELDNSMIAGIAHLVSASVPGLKKENVSIVDQHGRLLSNSSNNKESLLSNEQYSRTRQVENLYVQRIQSILSPILGVDNIRAQVTAEMDYKFIEKTAESFDNKNQVVKSEAVVSELKGNRSPVRSEVILDELTINSKTAEGEGGIPGALSNQPPVTSDAENNDEGAADDEDGADDKPEEKPHINKRQQATRNYEVGKSIIHTKHSNDSIKRISVAVVVNDKIIYNDKGEETRTPLTEEELAQIDKLVKDAIGYNENRGDTVTIASIAFAKLPPLAEPEPLKIYEEAWFMPVVKQSIAGLFIVIVLFIVVKPIVRDLSELVAIRRAALEKKDTDEEEAAKSKSLELPGPDVEAEQRMARVRQIAADDSKRVAQVIMNWVGNEDE